MSTTIFALSTAFAKSGVAVIRISGPESLRALCELTKQQKKLFRARYCYLMPLYAPATNELIDKALVVYFAAPASFTGEDVVELHIHGSIAVINEFLEILTNLSYLCPAEPGEFTRRAFDNGKMDLTQAEALADLIDAATKAQARLALRQMQGELYDLYHAWRDILITIMSRIEAYIDFPDEDIPDSVKQEFEVKIETLKSSIYSHLNDGRKGEILRSGIYISILGAPNVGKSSLINLLSKREIAIVSPIPGTTRDIIEVNLDLGGFLVTLADTAGLREISNDDIEKEGMRRSLQRAELSDYNLVVLDGSNLPDIDKKSLEFIDDRSIITINKSDIINCNIPTEIKGYPVFPISVKNRTGINDLLKIIENKITANFGEFTAPVITRERHRVLISEAFYCLEKINFANPPELIAELLRECACYIGKITGKIDVEELLDEIFSSFCIGK